jgi:plasmid stabilization system protein ParE
MRIIWSPVAAESVEAIRGRLAAFSIPAASDFTESIDRRVRQLELFPESGRAVPEYGLPLLRELVEPPYRIIYELFPDRVEIVIVRHGRENFQR